MISSPGAPIPLWLDCDPGHDDAFAILVAAHHPSLNLLGITTIHGNSSLENTTTNASRILEAIGRPEVPVYPGHNKPFCRPAIHAPNIHGDSGIEGTDLLPKASRQPITDENPILAMRNALLAHPKGTPWVIATGALTNVALLFATFPEVAEHIQGLSIMGGGVGEAFTDAPMSRQPGQETRIGNVTPSAEFNIYCDPESSQSILRNPVLAPKTTLITLDLTHQVLASPSVQTRILHCAEDPNLPPTPLRQMLYELLLFFASTYDTIFGLSTGPPLHDPLAVAVILSTLNPAFTKQHPDLALAFDDRGGERFDVTVETDGLHAPGPVTGQSQEEADAVAAKTTGELGRSRVVPAENGRGVAIPRGVDLEVFWGIILECIRRADECNAARVN